MSQVMDNFRRRMIDTNRSTLYHQVMNEFAKAQKGICSICANEGKILTGKPCVCKNQGVHGELQAVRDQLATAERFLEIMERALKDRIGLRDSRIHKLQEALKPFAEAMEQRVNHIDAGLHSKDFDVTDHVQSGSFYMALEAYKNA